MENRNFDSEKFQKFWSESSDEDFDTMLALYESKKYSWALFVGHLMIEKLLKAFFVQVNKDYPPFIHNLLLLAEKCKLELTDEQKLFFITVTAFNINARYDDYKMSFQKKCTPEFTSIWIEKIKINRIWIKEQIK
ncbi:MAG: DNA-binding protein [Bacteroidetes bacterium GWF2_43_63]|nr:MAG: DNA-binding protein [Bacteroidetes bacterium GWE2_42_42]OFY52469.1 MAG: DNA-binding protein [Bacteroidetes bacterium GWF2_43_63]HBG71376.1 DNA-binding protein [Bacteroidales bacterium]HCB60873.1 DNA-binding protein [Bacteroidales bacterium]HCY23952.1 DNA-binding protein [Bacteroidales bacterium]